MSGVPTPVLKLPAVGPPRLSASVLIAIIVTLLAWSSAFIVIRGVAPHFGGGALALARLAVGTVVLSLLLIGHRWVRPSAREWLLISVFGVAWFAAYNITLNIAEHTLDAGTKNYYDAGLILGAGVFDLSLSLTLLPYAAMAAFALVYVPSYALGGVPEVRGPIRTAALIGLLAAAFFLPMPTRTRAPLGRPGVDDPRPATTRI
jgi:hypothetical protein